MVEDSVVATNPKEGPLGTTSLLPATMQADLSNSGLEPSDVDAYIAHEAELTAVGLRPHMFLSQEGEAKNPGYVIPYFDHAGRRIPFYRVKLLNATARDAKYLQPAGSPSHVYFPRSFPIALQNTLAGNTRSCINGYRPALLIVEGEKKAAKAMKAGYLCVGLGGVYSWKTKTVMLPEDAKLEKDDRTGRIRVKFTSSMEEVDEAASKFSLLATGMQPLIDLIIQNQLQVVIAFDTDVPYNPKVQQAASSLGFLFRSKGIPVTRVRQLKLPSAGAKVGIDDYLMQNGEKSLEPLLHEVLSSRNAFPIFPNMREYVNGKLGGRLSRDSAKELALAVITDLDSRGMRLKEQGSDAPYYFDATTKSLMPVQLMRHHAEPLHEGIFGTLLYRNYDIAQADTKVIPWLAAAFTGEDPVETVSPRSVTALTEKGIAQQLSDGQFALITADSIRICDNGTEGLLFKADQVDPVDVNEFMREVQRQQQLKVENWWFKVLQGFKFTRDHDRTLAALLFYMSPWLLRWKGAQLPIELMIGEPGSGKSSMYALRLSILTGRPVLRNQPTDIRDWYSSITGTDGLHVIDNVQFATKEIRQRLSDEMCRIVTEPYPFVEMRKLFSTAENMRIPVRNAFALTAIQQPFVNADILQRSVIFELEAVGGEHDSSWTSNRLNERGGRASWMAHHAIVLQRFLTKAATDWNPNYKSNHRLAQFEQSLQMMAGVMGYEGDLQELSQRITNAMEESVSEYDWTMEGIKDFVIEHAGYAKNKNYRVGANDIATWAASKEDFTENAVITNARRLSRYIKSHAHMVHKVAGLKEDGKQANRVVYQLETIKRP